MSAAFAEYRTETAADFTETARVDPAALNAHTVQYGVMRTKTTKPLSRRNR